MSPQKFDYTIRTTPKGGRKEITRKLSKPEQNPDKTPNPTPEAMPPRPATPPPTGVETMMPMDGRRFECDMFTIHVGSLGHQLTAHETILAQSPYLRAKCLGGKQARQIHLPEYDIHIVRLVLEYLYGRTFNESVLGTGQELAQGLANVYILGCKFWLGSLTALVVNGFKDMPFLESEPKFLFRLAGKIYASTPPTDRAFKDYFVSTLVKCHQNAAHRFSDRDVGEYIEAGGQLAVDIHLAQQRWKIIAETEAAEQVNMGRRRSRRYTKVHGRLSAPGHYESSDSEETNVNSVDTASVGGSGHGSGGSGGSSDSLNF
ncbi:hypothetical protein MMC30_002888 [Trapelia coarctata]|nr:hypothetical protein [Trapelia coarctata]